MDGDAIGVRGKCSKISKVTTQDGSVRLGRRDHDGVNRGTLTRARSERCGPPSEVCRQALDHVARLQQTVDERVGVLASHECLDEHDRWDDWRPEAVALEDGDERSALLSPSRQSADRAPVEDEIRHAVAVERRSLRIREDSASARASASADGVPTSSISSAT